ncbi:MAG: response regulator [Microcoleaceae cyanobacterium]
MISKTDILIVDDTPNNLRILSSMLIEEGYQVRKAINGTMALRSALAEPPDLILLDIRMPEMNGYEVCTQLKAEAKTKEIPIIFLSALDNEKDKVTAFEVGGVDYVTKPLKLQEVLVRVKTHLTLQRTQQQLKQQNTRLQQEVKARAAAELALQKANRELQRLAHLDSVTHVANRLRFDEYLMFIWQDMAKKQQTLSLILCEIDHLEHQIKSLESSIIEENLRLIAWAINRRIKPPKELVARYSDFRFAIFLPNKSVDEVLQWVDKIRTEIAQLDIFSLWLPDTQNITVSLGMSSQIPETQIEPKKLVNQADKALQNAIEKGGDRVVISNLN